ncbi:hypothetical protein TorRG33x02_301390, partial [Trema orientale]
AHCGPWVELAQPIIFVGRAGPQKKKSGPAQPMGYPICGLGQSAGQDGPGRPIIAYHGPSQSSLSWAIPI